MTEQEAKEKLERTSVLWGSATNTGIVEAIKVAISALEKQIPNEPIGNDLCTCPKCGTYNETVKKRRNTVNIDIVYCWHCGQAMEIKRG